MNLETEISCRIGSELHTQKKIYYLLCKLRKTMVIRIVNSNFLLFCEVLLVYLICVGTENGECYRVAGDPFRRAANLGPRESYRLEWMVNEEVGRITFNLTVQTKGWVRFGLANDAGEKTGQDLVIGGVRENGQAYFSDRHTGRFNERLQTDITQDYTLDTSWENGPYTFLSFSRELDTCDHQDYTITENKVTVIWAFGDQDDVNGAGNVVHSGTYEVYLMDPEYTPRLIRENLYNQVPRITGRDSGSIQTWTLTNSLRIPRRETSYLCAVHKAPQLPKKHHVIGFDARFANEQSRNLTHHLIVYRCHAPRGSSAHDLFDSFARSGEQQSCYTPYRLAVGKMPVHLCTDVYMVWFMGGREFFVPDNVGFPLGEDSEEYYMLQAHYGNPTLTDARVTINVDFFHTRRLRPNDGGIFGLASNIPGLPESMLIPPQTPKMRIFGHCSGECTRKMFPQEGITLVGGVLHGQTSSKQMRLHHFRNNVELPWILYDDNYNKEFQEFRALRGHEVQVIPGDQLTMDCTYDNTWTNDTVTRGLQTRQEICVAYMVYYNLIRDYSFCHSGPVAPAYRQRFLGVTNVTWQESQLDWVAQPPSPKFLVGRTISDISDNWIEWDEDARRDLQKFHEQHPHSGSCSRNMYARDPEEIRDFLEGASQTGEVVIRDNFPTKLNTTSDYVGPVKYPFAAVPFALPDSCLIRGLFRRPGG